MCLRDLPRPLAPEDNSDLAFANSRYRTQPHPQIAYFFLHLLFFQLVSTFETHPSMILNRLNVLFE